MWTSIALIGLNLLVSLGCVRQITRISNGTAQREREISPNAYAAFARARIEEAKGNTVAAIAGYREVVRLDSSASEAWMRIGILQCKQGTVADADRDFGRAERLDPGSSRLFAAKAECALTRHDTATGARFAILALHFAPDDVDISRLLIRALSADGKREEALRYGWSHVATFPNDAAGWTQLSGMFASSPRLWQELLRTTAQHSAIMPGTARLSAPAQKRAELDLLHGLASDDRRATQRAARDLRLSVDELADRSSELGAIEFAYSQAELAVSIEPEDPHRWLRLLILADWLGKEDAFEALLRHPPAALKGTLTDAERASLTALVGRRAAIDWVPEH